MADTLSRAPFYGENDVIADDVERHLHVVTLAGIPASDGMFQELAIETQRDEELATIVEYLRTGWPRSRKQAREFVRQYFDQ